MRTKSFRKNLSSLGFVSATLFALCIIAAIIIFQKPSEVRLDKPSENATYEIYAKQSYWDKISDPVVILTFFLTISTLFLWVATADLAQVAGDQASDLLRSIQAAEKAAEAAKRTADALTASEGSVIRELVRPINFGDFFVLARWDKSPSMGSIKRNIAVELRFKNYGKTPADIIIYGWQIIIAARQPANSDFIIFPRQFTMSEATVSAGSISEDVGSVEEIEITWIISGELARRQKYVWFCGWVQFADVFGQTQTRSFVWRYDGSRNAFTPCDPNTK